MADRSNVRAPSRLRDIAVSSFVVFHIVALLWWNLGVIEYRTRVDERDAISRLRRAVEFVDRSGVLRGTLDGYVRASGLWQSWILFGPDAPHVTGRVELFGIVGFDRERRPILDPVPLRTSLAPSITERTQLIGNPPCGWTRGDDPRAAFLRGSYARWHAERATRAYVGAQLVCSTRPIPLPGAPATPLEWSSELLWGGPLGEVSPR